MAAEVQGQWSTPFDLSNVAVHVNLLLSGKVLYWGRRENLKVIPAQSNLNEQFGKAFVWDPATKTSIPTANEALGVDGKPVNLFCAGHAFLPDGTLFSSRVVTSKTAGEAIKPASTTIAPTPSSPRFR